MVNSRVKYFGKIVGIYLRPRNRTIDSLGDLLQSSQCVDEQSPLVQVIFFLGKPPFIDFSAKRDLLAWSETSFDAGDGVSHGCQTIALTNIREP